MFIVAYIIIYIHIHSYIYTIYIYIYILLVLFLCYILYKFAHNFQFAVAHDSGVAGRPPEGPASDGVMQWLYHDGAAYWPFGSSWIHWAVSNFGWHMTYEYEWNMKIYEMTIWMAYSIGQMNMTYEWNWMNQASRRALKPPTSPAGWIWKMLGQRWSNLWLVVSTLKNLWPLWIIILCKIY